MCLKAFWDRIVVVDGERVLAEHRRRYGGGESLAADHYLPLLERKPHAVAHARVFRHLSPAYQAFRQRCLAGPNPRPREFLAVLRLHEPFAQPVVERALEQALAAGVILADAVRQLCLHQLPGQELPPPLAEAQVPAMSSWSPDPGRYDALMGSVAAR